MTAVLIIVLILVVLVLGSISLTSAAATLTAAKAAHASAQAAQLSAATVLVDKIGDIVLSAFAVFCFIAAIALYIAWRKSESKPRKNITIQPRLASGEDAPKLAMTAQSGEPVNQLVQLMIIKTIREMEERNGR
ncbi:MAG: hypothetical protein WC322_07085 [Candidatus Paceibacterota bacterium]|jgi:flagellar basal body-associated protein FliL